MKLHRLERGEILILPTGQVIIGDPSLGCGYTWFLNWDSYLTYTGDWIKFPLY